MTSFGRAAQTLPEHPSDVVCLVKRHASDANLFQEVMLAVPYVRLFRLPPLPTRPKPFKKIPVDKKKGGLDLAQFMLSQRGNLDVARTAKFLIGLVTDPNPTEMVPLPWFATPSEVDPEPPRLPSSLDRLAPVMKFKATIRSVADDPR